MFNNRELALLFWVGVLLIFAIASKRIRPSLIAVLHAIFEPKLLTIFILMAAYAGLLVWLLSLAHIWTPAVTAETVFWFFGPAIVLFSKFNTAGRDPHFFRRTALATLTITVVIEFLINLYLT
jgi:hypothetical protein